MRKLLTLFGIALFAIGFVGCDKDDDDGDGGFEIVVDLGLPSGTLWATCNLGATNPWDYGDYYAWGETTTKSDYSWETYKYGSYNSLTKYCNNSEYGKDGYTDALTTLQPSDDAATAVLGSDYVMPTAADWQELANLCCWVLTTDYNGNGVSGYIVYKAKQDGDKGTQVSRYSDNTPSASYSLSDVHIFLPAAGCSGDTFFANAGSGGYYWSASLGEHPSSAHFCSFYSSGVLADYDGIVRYNGLSVRPVRRRMN